jgi:hypothetical protein
MKAVFFAAVFLVTAVIPVVSRAQTPTMTTVDPTFGKSGDTLIVTGNNLDRSHVAALYLTDEKTDIKLAIVEQTATSIKFTIPPGVKPGDFALEVLTQGQTPKLIEEPVRVTTQ